MTNQGERYTVLSFDPFFARAEIRKLTDARIARKIGITPADVKAMRRRADVSTAVVRQICHVLQCQPVDIMEALTAYKIPAKHQDTTGTTGTTGNP